VTLSSASRSVCRRIAASSLVSCYCGRTDEPSRRILDKTLNLLKHIEPALREVLAFELARSSLSAPDLVDVMAEWKNEPDTEIRRNAFIGLLRAIKRHQQTHNDVAGSDTFTPEMEWLRGEIKDDLCAYGDEFEERRQLAWIGMLMLGDLTLIDGIEETIGHSGAPGVKLDVLYDGDVDQILVDLVAENWERLCAHFGDEIFERLNRKSDSQRRTASEQRRYVMSALATVASRYPAITEMLRREADSNATLREDRHFLLWAKEENKGDEGVLRALVTNLDEVRHGRHDQGLDSLLDRDSWKCVRRRVQGRPHRGRERRPADDLMGGKPIAYTQLFPAVSLSIAVLRDLETWFEVVPARRGHRSWDETLAIALGAAEPQDLPAIATRAHTRLRMAQLEQANLGGAQLRQARLAWLNYGKPTCGTTSRSQECHSPRLRQLPTVGVRQRRAHRRQHRRVAHRTGPRRPRTRAATQPAAPPGASPAQPPPLVGSGHRWVVGWWPGPRRASVGFEAMGVGLSEVAFSPGSSRVAAEPTMRGSGSPTISGSLSS
jgi:hypothetical protein